MTFGAKPVKLALQIFDAMTGANWFSISFGTRGLGTYFISGNILNITFKNGQTEIWDLVKRRKIR